MKTSFGIKVVSQNFIVKISIFSEKCKCGILNKESQLFILTDENQLKLLKSDF